MGGWLKRRIVFLDFTNTKKNIKKGCGKNSNYDVILREDVFSRFFAVVVSKLGTIIEQKKI